MRTKLFMVIAVFISALASCGDGADNKKEDQTAMKNPLLEQSTAPFGVTEFEKIKVEHYAPALEKAMADHNAEIDAIISNTEEATFENTIEAMAESGELLNSVTSIFYNLLSADTNPEMEKLAEDFAPKLSKHSDDISLNAKLFERVKAVYTQKDELTLTEEQAMLLQKTYDGFVRNGANLDEEKKEELRKINSELSTLSLKYGQNVLAETNSFEMLLEKEEDLAGLPESVRTAAAEAAKAKGYTGKWLFTTQRPSLYPFLTYSEKRDLRKQLLLAYANRGDNNNEYDNKELAVKMANLRLKKANLLGYETYSNYVLDDNMAKNPENVYKLLNQVWDAAIPMAKAEVAEMQKMIDAEGGKFKLEAWDWWYYAEKVRAQKYNLSDEEMRPYFKFENVRKGAFDVAGKLWGLKFVPRTDIPKYHPDIEVFDVQEKDGTHIGILYMDYFMRASKQGGAWMTEYRPQYKKDGVNVTPIISNTFNFAPSTADKPTLLSLDEAQTIFHEFGHGLHGLLSNVNYQELSGTNVPRDFVELPSQVFENWATEPAVLKQYAKHYQTGEVIPDELIAKIQNSAHFNQGFTTVEYMSAALMDLDWHTITEPITIGANDFEKASLEKMGLIPEIIVRYRSTYFTHIFSGGYSSGYYSYIWAEVLDADAFQAFKETDVFDQATAKAYRDNILSNGGTKDAMEMYKNFRGREPKIDALLERKGMLKKTVQ